MNDLSKKFNSLARYLGRDFGRKVARIAIDHFEDSFVNEAFSDKTTGDMAWPDVKRRTQPKKGAEERADARRKILIGTGNLSGSLASHVSEREISISTDLSYAQIHNEGGDGLAFGKHPFKMKRRQFMGKSAILEQKIQDTLQKDTARILGK